MHWKGEVTSHHGGIAMVAHPFLGHGCLRTSGRRRVPRFMDEIVPGRVDLSQRPVVMDPEPRRIDSTMEDVRNDLPSFVTAAPHGPPFAELLVEGRVR